MKWWPADCSMGDMIRIKIGSIYHYGIFVSDDEVIQFGEPPIGSLLERDNSDVRVCTATADEFSCGNIIEVAQLDKREKRERFSPDRTVEIARSRIGEGDYNLIHNNCEHFVYECVFGVKKSTQEDEARERWRNRPILSVYIARAEDMGEITDVTPPQRNAEIERMRDKTAKAEKFAVWKLLEFAVRDSFGKELSECSPKKSLGGKWSCEGLCFSLSHSGGVVAVAVSNADVGVDVEHIGRFRETHTDEKLLKLASHIGADIANADDRHLAFLYAWTRKECIFKKLGRGVFVPSRIDADDAETRSGILALEPEVYVSVSGKHSAAARFFFCDKPGEKTPANTKFTESLN